MGSNIIELAKLGHERAAELKGSFEAINACSVAQLISDLATQLEVQLARGNAQAVQLANAESKCREMAAENAGLNVFIEEECFVYSSDTPEPIDANDCKPETPATDAFMAEVQASARNEGINYAASRLAAAYNHGFIGKSMSEVADVVRMILDAKTDLANSIILPADGLSGEYAEKSLAEFADQLRKDKPEGAKS
ncbi:ead/Ea22-like family protein [Citrobacter freundii]|uniref:ead/Ea22-like family protein n=1 Tax=Citrobacter freundii TaxID=546 RepID=UPI001927D38F|nr:ead/Ea22-like family protein [Citrobacter freundii]CAD5353637.1 conserved protein of unknown function [Citrobacter freundii]